jgi:hypothetical protein
VRLHAPAEQIAAKITPPAGLVTPVNAQTCLLETGTDSLYDLCTYLAKLEVGFEMVDPPQLGAAARARRPVRRRRGLGAAGAQPREVGGPHLLPQRRPLR